MPGPFDDLLVPEAPARGGMFDDLLVPESPKPDLPLGQDLLASLTSGGSAAFQGIAAGPALAEALVRSGSGALSDAIGIELPMARMPAPGGLSPLGQYLEAQSIQQQNDAMRQAHARPGIMQEMASGAVGSIPSVLEALSGGMAARVPEVATAGAKTLARALGGAQAAGVSTFRGEAQADPTATGIANAGAQGLIEGAFTFLGGRGGVEAILQQRGPMALREALRGFLGQAGEELGEEGLTSFTQAIAEQAIKQGQLNLPEATHQGVIGAGAGSMMAGAINAPGLAQDAARPIMEQVQEARRNRMLANALANGEMATDPAPGSVGQALRQPAPPQPAPGPLDEMLARAQAAPAQEREQRRQEQERGLRDLLARIDATLAESQPQAAPTGPQSGGMPEQQPQDLMTALEQTLAAGRQPMEVLRAPAPAPMARGPVPGTASQAPAGRPPAPVPPAQPIQKGGHREEVQQAETEAQGQVARPGQVINPAPKPGEMFTATHRHIGNFRTQQEAEAAVAGLPGGEVGINGPGFKPSTKFWAFQKIDPAAAPSAQTVTGSATAPASQPGAAQPAAGPSGSSPGAASIQPSGTAARVQAVLQEAVAAGRLPQAFPKVIANVSAIIDRTPEAAQHIKAGTLHPDNRVSREAFTRITGQKLPKTVKGTDEVLGKWLRGEAPAQQAQATTPVVERQPTTNPVVSGETPVRAPQAQPAPSAANDRQDAQPTAPEPVANAMSTILDRLIQTRPEAIQSVVNTPQAANATIRRAIQEIGGELVGQTAANDPAQARAIADAVTDRTDDMIRMLRGRIVDRQKPVGDSQAEVLSNRMRTVQERAIDAALADAPDAIRRTKEKEAEAERNAKNAAIIEGLNANNPTDGSFQREAAPADDLDAKLARAKAKAREALAAKERQQEQQAKATEATADQKAALEKMRRILRGQGPAASTGGPLFDAAWELVEASIRRGVSSFRAMLEGIRSDAAELASMRQFQEIMEAAWDAAHSEGLVEPRGESAAQVYGQPTEAAPPAAASPDGPEPVASATKEATNERPMGQRGGARSGRSKRPGDAPNAGQGTPSGAAAGGDRSGGSDGGDATRPDARADAGAGGEVGGGEQAERPDGKPERASVEQPTATRPTGFRFASIEDAMPPKGEITRARANLDAIETMQRVQGEGRAPTEEERATIARFSGWGSLKWVFKQETMWSSDNSRREIAQRASALMQGEAREVAEASTEASDEAAPEVSASETRTAAIISTLNAHYTNPQVVDQVWQIVSKMMSQVKGRLRVLEPSVGMGAFIGLEPQALRGRAAWTAVELEPNTAAMARMVYSDAQVLTTGFQKFDVPDNSYDLVISNVPFGSYRPYERRYSKQGRPLIHDFFFLKSLDKVRPGGLVAFITSTGTLDKPDATIRRALYEQGDLVQAIRFPADAHDTAGTSVVTDLVILRKRMPGEKPGDDAWITVGTTPDAKGGSPIPLNNYFAKNPKMVLGQAERTGKLWGLEKNGEKRPNFVARPTYDAEVAAAIAAAPKGVMTPAAAGRAAAVTIPAPAELRPYSLVSKDGKVWQKQGADLVVIKDSKADAERVKWMRNLVDALRRVWTVEISGQDAADQRANLNRLYDAGVAKHGALNLPANSRLFRPDPDAANLLALEKMTSDDNEDDDSKMTWAKGEAFERPTVRPPRVMGKAETPQQGVAASLGRSGTVVPETVAEAMGVSVEQAERKMRESGAAFEDPMQGWQPASAYLSGNVRAKLAQATEAARRDPARYEANVEALTKVQPKDKEPHEVVPVMGAPWIAEDILRRFLMIEVPGVTVVPGPEARWIVDGDGNAGAMATWGVQGQYRMATAGEIVEAALNGSRVDMSRRTKDETMHDKEAEISATQRANELRAKFTEWMRLPEQTDAMLEVAKAYNEQVNVFHQAEVDESWITFDGMNPSVQMDPHQRRIVARAILDGRVMAAHEVGTGKTYSLIAAAIEMKRLGVSRKPVIATLNNVVPQFGRDAAKLYPGKNMLIQPAEWGDKGTATSREVFMSRLANQDFDLAIVSHETLTSLPNDPRVEAERLGEVLAELEAAHQALSYRANRDRSKGKSESRAISAMAKRIESTKARMEELADHALKVEHVTFEQTGIDYLLIDEAHAFKNLPVITSMEGVLGLGGADAKRAEDLLMKSKTLHSRNGGERGLILATGTPISNTMVEVFAFQQMMQPKALRASGLRYFDAWAKSFGTTKQSNEVQADGTRKNTTRFAEWVNLSGLAAMLGDFMDVKLTQDIPRVRAALPAVAEVPVKVPLSMKQRAFREWTQVRLDRIKTQGKPIKGMDIALSAMRDAQMSAIDMRMVDPSATDQDGSKVPALVQGVGELYRDGQRIEGKAPVQFIFQDVQSNPTVWGFTLNAAIVSGLVDQGIPAESIAVLDGNTPPAKRAKIKAEAALGKYAVLIGSTSVLGTGTNAQQYALATWHIDAPHRPADIIQRDGRMVRQGNLYKQSGVTVKAHRVITEETMDEALWARLALKKDFIYKALAAVRDGAGIEDMEEVQTDGFSPDMIAAISSGDRDLIRLVELDTEIATLSRQSNAHYNQRTYRESQARSQDAQAAGWESSAKKAGELAAQVMGKIPEKAQLDDGKTSEQLAAELERMIAAPWPMGTKPQQIGSYAGIPVVITGKTADGFGDKYKVVMTYTYASHSGQATTGAGMLGALRQFANSFAASERDATAAAAKLRKQAEANRTAASKLSAWPKEDELAAKEVEAQEIAVRMRDRPKIPSSMTPEAREAFEEGLKRRKDAAKAEAERKATKRAAKSGVVREGKEGYGDFHDDRDHQGALGRIPPGNQERAERHRRGAPEVRTSDLTDGGRDEAERAGQEPGRDQVIRRLLAGEGGSLEPGERITNLMDGLVRGDLAAIPVLRGAKVETPTDAALLLASIRSPFVERVGWVLVRDGQVIHNGLWSIGTIDAAMVPERAEVEALAEQIGAQPGDQWVWAHNHPSGNPSPSKEDLSAYELMRYAAQDMGITFMGLVLNGDRFALVNRDKHKLIPYNAEQYRKPYDGARIGSARDAATYTKSLSVAPGTSLVIHLGPALQVVGVESIPRRVPFPRQVEQGRMSSGAVQSVVVSGNPNITKTPYDPRTVETVVVDQDGNLLSAGRAKDTFDPESMEDKGITVPNIVREDKSTYARPDLAGFGTGDARRMGNITDEALKAFGRQGQSDTAIREQAEGRMQDPAAVEAVTQRILAGKSLSAVEAVMARQIIARTWTHAVETNDPQAEHRAALMQAAYRAEGSRLSDEFRARRDQHMKPADRALAALLEMATEPWGDVARIRDQLMRDLQQANARVEDAEERVERARRRVEQAESDMAGGDPTVGSDWAAELNRMEAEATSIKDELDRIATDQAQRQAGEQAQRDAERADMEQRLADLNRQIEDGRKREQDQADMLTEARGDIRRAKADRQDLLDAARHDFATATKILEEAKAERDAILKRLDDMQARMKAQRDELKQALIREGMSLDALIQHFRGGRRLTPGQVADAFGALMRARQGGIAPTLQSWWINWGLLSAPSTFTTNMFGALYGGYATAVEPAMAAIARGAVTPEARKAWGRAGRIWQAMADRGVWQQAFRNFGMTWRLGIPVLEAQNAYGTRDEGEMIAGFIADNQKLKGNRMGGQEAQDRVIGAGRGGWLRWPGRLMGATDQLLQTLWAYAQVANEAEMLAEENKTPDAEIPAMVAAMVADPASKAWERATRFSELASFNDEPSKVAQALLSLRNTDIPGTNIKPLMYLLPFVSTVDRLLARGIGMTPAGSIAVAYRAMKLLRTPAADRTPKMADEVWRGVGSQLISWAVTGFIAAAVLGRDDDDEPWITGSQKVVRGGQDYPAYSIRVGNEWKSYRRLDPFSTATGVAVDLMERIRAGKHHDGDAAVDALKSVGSTILEKSYTQGLSDLFEVAQGQKNGGAWLADFAASWAPSFVRGAGRAAYPENQRTRVLADSTGDWWLKVGERALEGVWAGLGTPGVDYTGRNTSGAWDRSSSNMLERFVSPIASKEAMPPAAAKWLRQHNDQFPEEAYQPMQMDPWLHDNGQRILLGDDEAREMRLDAGRLAAPALERLARMPVTARRAKAFKAIVARSRKLARKRALGRRKAKLRRA